MIFLDYWTISIVVGCIAIVAFGVMMFLKIRATRPLIKIPTQVLSLILIVSSGGLLFIFGCASVWNVTTHSAPLYSSDHRQALRVEDVDSGALGGFTTITLYSKHGLSARNIFSGEWKQAEAQTVHWISNSEILIRYDASYRTAPICKSVNGVLVRCEPVTYTYPH